MKTYIKPEATITNVQSCGMIAESLGKFNQEITDSSKILVKGNEWDIWGNDNDFDDEDF